VAQCATFYWKKSGSSNCVCMTPFQSMQQNTVSLDAVTIKQFQPSCSGGDADYGFYQTNATDTNGRQLRARPRRLLQQEDEDNSTSSSEESFESSTEMEQNNTLHDDSQSPETGSNIAFRQVAVNNNNSASTPLIIPLDNEFNNTESQEDFASSQESQPTPVVIPLDNDFNNTASQEDFNDTQADNLNVVALNDTQANADFEASSSEESSESSEEAFVAPKAKKQCFDVPAAPKNKTEILCSSKASTPVALPRAWLLMNNLNPDVGPPCKTWKPAVGTKSISCVNV